MTADESRLARELRTNGVDVEEVRVTPERFAVAYTTTLPGAEPDHAEMGRICNTFIDLVEADEVDARRIEATSLRFENDVQATWCVEPDWIDGLTTYRLSEEEFSARVLDSVEVDPDDTPLVDAGGGGR
ncbi:hypothetical protein [Halobaculum marinum]|uniref:DUF8159 domain-containing protein n=1 Tax=Halobaculum marinum TaxID=3031996 RepID=A0ABD5WXI8_9EURY|nr:hypothetical protein [Halobaculum sp. DT55]